MYEKHTNQGVPTFSIAVKFGLCNFTDGPHMSKHFPPVLISISVYMKHVEVNVLVSDAVVSGGLN